MTAKTPERLRREAARECAEQLAVVVNECSWDAAMVWLNTRLNELKFTCEELALVSATMIDQSEDNAAAYRSVVAERFGIGTAKK